MAGAIHDGLELIFGAGLVESLSTWMTNLFASLQDIFDSNLMGVALTLFSGIACSLLIIYFFMELVNQASKDMFSFEKLVISIIKLFIAFAVLLCLKEIIDGILAIGHYLYLMVSQESFKSSLLGLGGGDEAAGFTFHFGDYEGDTFPAWEEVQDDFEDHYGNILTALPMFMSLILPQILGFVAKLAGYFITTSNGVMIIIRALFSPIAIVQLFEEGTRSAGMKYIKKFAADCITMGVIIVVLYASSMLTSALLANSSAFQDLQGNVITFENVSRATSLGNMVIILLPQLVTIGAMIGVSKITNDIVGSQG